MVRNRRAQIGWILFGFVLRDAVGYALDAVLGKRQSAVAPLPRIKPAHPEFILFRGVRNGGREAVP